MSCLYQNGTTIHSSIYAALVIIGVALYGTMDDKKDGQENTGYTQAEVGLDTAATADDSSLGDKSPKSPIIDRR